MLKFQELILQKFIVLFIVLFLSVGGIVYYWIKEFYISGTKESLEQNIEMLSYQLNTNKNLDKLALQIKNNLNIRLTMILEDGTVIAESHFDKSTMDNHKYRDEIMKASYDDFGSIIRHSKTINKDLLYIAKKYTFSNKIIYIRLAKELENINDKIYSLGFKILGVLTLFFMALFIITYKISMQIQAETNRILKFLKDLTKKKKDNYISSNYSKEFSQITRLLTKVSQILIKQDKQKAKYTSKLKTANEQKDDIISAISHEFKNPIAVINGYTQTLLEDPNLNKDIQTKFLTKIYKNGNRIDELIDTLRLSTKLDSGKQTINLSTFNLYDLLLDIMENIKLTYKNRELILQGDKSISIKADETLFSIVITNFIENACKYSEDEVIIKIDNNSLSVIDTGIGMQEKDISKITEKFYRVSSNTWNNSLGLGLFLANNIINLHNFKLKILSVENEGSTFKIEF
ncbi:MAG: ATP-binding protein [Campylobacterota bacterium]|nr:ATP-binding protein [Campylobacterota bacterium]